MVWDILGSWMYAYCTRPSSLCIARPGRSIGLKKYSCAQGGTADQTVMDIEWVTSVGEKPIREEGG